MLNAHVGAKNVTQQTYWLLSVADFQLMPMYSWIVLLQNQLAAICAHSA